MTDLVSWLEEQITEDERQAEVARVHGHDAQDVDSTVSDYVLGDPARVLAECAAKRKIIAEAFEAAALVDSEWGCCHSADAIRAGECECSPVEGIGLLRILASVYADRPGYQPEWSAQS